MRPCQPIITATNDQAALPYNWERCHRQGRTYFMDHSSRATHWNFNPSLVLPPPSAARSATTRWQLGDLCEINFRGSWYSGVVVGVQRSAPRKAPRTGVFDVLFDAHRLTRGLGPRGQGRGSCECRWCVLQLERIIHAASASCGGGSDSVAERPSPVLPRGTFDFRASR